MARPRVAQTKRGARTRQQILDVTRRLLATPGFRGVTLDQVAEETGTAKSSILWHFGTKEDLLLEVLDSTMRDLERSYSQSYPDNLPLLDKVRLFIKDYVSLMERYPELGTVFFGMLFDAELITAIRDRVKEMYRDYRQMIVHHLSTPAYPVSEELAACVTALLDGVFIQWYMDPQRIDLEKVLTSVVSGLEFLASHGTAQRTASTKSRGKAKEAEKQVPKTRRRRGR